MAPLTDDQLNMRINAFITKKHQQYPELRLRGREKRAKSLNRFLAEKISGYIANASPAKLAH